MAGQTLEIKRSSAAMWGSKTGIRSTPTIAKYIDTTTCIGCKACEAACQEWNDQGAVATQQTGTYQTLPHLDAKNGIVDVDPSKCIGCGYCATGCPFDVPKFHVKTGKMAKCTLCVDRVEVGLEPACVKACPTGCLNFGTKDDMVALGNARVSQLQADGFKDAALYDPKGVGGTSVVTVLGHGHPEWYDLPADPHVSLFVRLWKSVLRPVGVLAGLATAIAAFGHFTKYGPVEPPSGGGNNDSPN